MSEKIDFEKSLEELAKLYLDLDVSEYSNKEIKENEQTSLFDELPSKEAEFNFLYAMYSYAIAKLEPKLTEELQKINILRFVYVLPFMHISPRNGLTIRSCNYLRLHIHTHV